MKFRQIVLAIAIWLSFLNANFGIAQNSRPRNNTTSTEASTSGDRRVISQIHNAPGWLHSHKYSYAEAPFTRVLNGPGWDEVASTFVPGRSLDAYQLVSTGSCQSAGSGGPLGSGDIIADGTCTWKHLSVVDYVTITGWAADNQAWKANTLYHYFDVITADVPLRAYSLLDDSCNSKVSPQGTGVSGSTDISTEDGCHWRYQADILYSSEKSYIPTETFRDTKSAATPKMRASYEARLWNDREYVAGERGETSPIRAQAHNDYMHEGGVVEGGPAGGPYHIILTSAPGESFADRLRPDDAITGYDPKQGVAIRNSLPYQWPYPPSGFDPHDNFTDLIGLQIKSIHGPAVDAMTSFGNGLLIENCILEGGSEDEWTAHAGLAVDTSALIANSLIISHAPVGILFKYPGFLAHSTVVTPDHRSDSVGVDTFNSWVFADTTVSNTAIFGFAHTAAHHEPNTGWSTHSTHNVTDSPPGDAGKGAWPFADHPQPTIVDILPGTKYGASAANVFVIPGSDWRLRRDSPLIGAGVALGNIAPACMRNDPSCAQSIKFDVDSPDLIGTQRPQAGRYDIGAWQSCPSTSMGGSDSCRSH